MNEESLDEVLCEYRARNVPPLSGAFAQDVLREVRLRSTQPNPGWLADFLSMVLRPAALAASFTTAVAVGATLPVLARDSDAKLAAHSLDLNVFSSMAPSVPSGLLSRLP